MTDSTDTYTLQQFPEKLVGRPAARPAPRSRLGRVVLAVLDHRHRHRDLARLRRPQRAEEGRAQQGPFTAFAVEGPLDFALTGVLAALLAPLAEAGISVFTISTYDTDWMLVPSRERDAAAEAWRRRGHTVAPASRRHPEGTPMSVTHPSGFRGRRRHGRPEVDRRHGPGAGRQPGPCLDSASVFTANRCKANPVLWSQEVVKDGVVRAVVLNSGGANCYTGPDGFQTTHAVAEQVAAGLGIGAIDVVVCSTGLIGLANPRQKLLDGVDAAFAPLGPHGGDDAARAIMTTDHVPQAGRRRGRRLEHRRHGQGRRHARAPAGHDAGRAHHRRHRAGRDLDTRCARRPGSAFDRLDSDGCMSTNDTVTLLASGASGVKPTFEEFSGRWCGPAPSWRSRPSGSRAPRWSTAPCTSPRSRRAGGRHRPAPARSTRRCSHRRWRRGRRWKAGGSPPLSSLRFRHLR